jgi:hypothetical protein
MRAALQRTQLRCRRTFRYRVGRIAGVFVSLSRFLAPRHKRVSPRSRSAPPHARRHRRRAKLRMQGSRVFPASSVSREAGGAPCLARSAGLSGRPRGARHAQPESVPCWPRKRGASPVPTAYPWRYRSRSPLRTTALSGLRLLGPRGWRGCSARTAGGSAVLHLAWPELWSWLGDDLRCGELRRAGRDRLRWRC